jgi:hypothetical protein
MEVGLVIQGNPVWDFLEPIRGLCALYTPREPFLSHAGKAIAGRFPGYMPCTIGGYYWRRKNEKAHFSFPK